MNELRKKIFYILPKGDSVRVTVLFILMLVAALLEVVGIGMIPAFVAVVADPERVLAYEPLTEIFQLLNINSGEELLIFGSISLVAVFLLKSVYMITFNFFEARFIYNRRYTISHRMMSSYMQAPYTFHLQKNTAELLRNMTRDVNVVVNIILTNLLRISREAIMVLSIVIFLFAVEPIITLIVMVLSVLGAGSFLLLTQKKIKLYGAQEHESWRKMIQAINQGLGGIKDARVLNREKEFIEKFREEAYKSTRMMAHIRFIQQIPKPVVETTAVIGMMLISALMVWQGRPLALIIPILTLFAMATVRLMPSIQNISSMYANLRYNMVALNPVYDDLKELDEYRTKLIKDRRSKEKLKFDHSIQFENVFYSYPDSQEQALHGVTLEIPKGKAVAFVGESGAGKTTLVDLLLGLLDPVKGSIKVDDLNIQERLSAWQRNIGYIPQSIYLADESLRRNIAFGLPDKEINEEFVNRAVKLSQLEGMLSRMPNGLDTIIGENGTRLSGGQRQRVGIARALYHNPEVLVMDEATSALDNITEMEITNAIEDLKGERTIVMIAHRLTTVQNCDVLYLMKNGEIIDSGSYNELISKNDEFRKMAMVPDKDLI